MRNKYYIVNVPPWGKVYYIVNLPGGVNLLWGVFTVWHRHCRVPTDDNSINLSILFRGRRGWDHMVVVLTISVYHHWCCEFESRSGRGVLHYVLKFVSALRQVGSFLWILRFPPPIKLTATINNWNIVESGVKHHQTIKQTIKPFFHALSVSYTHLLVY